MTNNFGKTSSGLNTAVETQCPIDHLPMRMREKTLLARIPRQNHTEIRRVHAACVPVDSPDYPKAVHLVEE